VEVVLGRSVVALPLRLLDNELSRCSIMAHVFEVVDQVIRIINLPTLDEVELRYCMLGGRKLQDTPRTTLNFLPSYP
jgi:hypothetical protein